MKNTKNKLEKRGKSTLEAEIQNISKFGIWLLVQGKEYFLSYKDFPWFKGAKPNSIKNVRLINQDHLHWPALDVDLELESVKKPQKYPLKYKEK